MEDNINKQGEEDMNVKKVTISTISLLMAVSQLYGCSIVNSKQLYQMLENGEEIEIEVPIKNGVTVQEDTGSYEELIPVLAERRDNINFRNEFKRVFNVALYDASLNGVMYSDEAGRYTADNNLMTALKNKKFYVKYLTNEDIIKEVIDIGYEQFVDTTADSEAFLASLNGYFNIVGGGNEKEFKSNTAMTRGDFLIALDRISENLSTPLTAEEEEAFNKLSFVANEQKRKSIARAEKYGYLNLENGQLNEKTINKVITRAEAMYAVVNKFYREDLDTLLSRRKEARKIYCYNDLKDGGNMLVKCGFASEDENEVGKINKRPNAESAYIEYLVMNPDKAVDDEMYFTMVIMSKKGLLKESYLSNAVQTEARLYDVISKEETISLLLEVAKNKAQEEGFTINVDFGAKPGDQPISGDIVNLDETGEQISKEIENKLN